MAPAQRHSICFGRLSYPLYILHYPLIRVFSHFGNPDALHGVKLWSLIAAEILGAVGFSIILMKFFDEPVRAWAVKHHGLTFGI